MWRGTLGRGDGVDERDGEWTGARLNDVEGIEEVLGCKWIRVSEEEGISLDFHL